MPSDIQLDLVPSELLPQKSADDTLAKKLATSDGYGRLFLAGPVGTLHLLDDEGCKFVATTPVPGTAVAYGSGGTQATWSDTTAFLVVQNTSPPGSGKKLKIHSLKILVSGTVPASATSTQFAVRVDPASRIPTANATLLTPQTGVPASPQGIASTNTAAPVPPVAVWVPNAGVPAIPASGPNARTVGRGSLRQTISVTLDEYILMFGGPDGPGTANGAGAGRFVGSCPSFLLNPQEFAVIHLWQPSGATNPLTCEIELSGWVK